MKRVLKACAHRSLAVAALLRAQLTDHDSEARTAQ